MPTPLSVRRSVELAPGTASPRFDPGGAKLSQCTELVSCVAGEATADVPETSNAANANATIHSVRVIPNSSPESGFECRSSRDGRGLAEARPAVYVATLEARQQCAVEHSRGWRRPV